MLTPGQNTDLEEVQQPASQKAADRVRECTCDEVGVQDGVQLAIGCTQVLSSFQSSWQVTGSHACCHNHIVDAGISELRGQELDIVQSVL